MSNNSRRIIGNNYTPSRNEAPGSWTPNEILQFRKEFHWPALYSVRYVALGGGGQGGDDIAVTDAPGGGGGGGFLSSTTNFSTDGTYLITVGAGGTYGAGRGVDSSIIKSSCSIIAYGGGAGSRGDSVLGNGGSGGGSSESSGAGKGVYPGSTYLDQVRQGYDGAGGTNAGGGGNTGGGGGGAGGPGSGQQGGTGAVNPITGSFVGGESYGNNGSLAFLGSQFLTITANAAFSYGSNDFTWECWVYSTSRTDTQQIIDFWSNGIGSYIIGQCQFAITITGALSFAYATSLSNPTANITTSADIVPLNIWTHVAVVRYGSSIGNLKIYVNGIVSATSPAAVTQTIGSTGAGSIGMQTNNGTNKFFGYISNVRIVNNLAVYTGGFLVPTGPLTAIQSAGINIQEITDLNSVVLLLLVNSEASYITDSSIYNRTLTNNGVTYSSRYYPVSRTALYYLGGGGGAVYYGASGSQGLGGIGGGGPATASTVNSSGSPNTGGGGGGIAGYGGVSGGTGGSGAVVISYPNTNPMPTYTAGTINFINTGGNYIFEFLTTGVMVF